MCSRHGDGVYHYRDKNRREKWNCSQCVGDRVIQKRKSNKQALVAKFGGKCQICGYCRTNRALDFHHRDEKKKSFGLGGRGSFALASLMKEAEKCVLLCSNCHREVHEGLVEIPPRVEVSLVEFDKNPACQRYCLDCQKKIARKSTRCKPCEGLIRRAAKKTKVEWGTPEEVFAMVQAQSYLAVSRDLGVTDNAIRHYLARRGFQPPKKQKTTHRPKQDSRPINEV